VKPAAWHRSPLTPVPVRPASIPAVGAAVALLLLLIRWQQHVFGWSFEDLAVYRTGGAAVLASRSPYAAVPGVLPFTYPPFAAIVFVPAQLIGPAAAALALSVASLASLVVLVVAAGRALGMGRSEVLVAAMLSLALEPVLRTLRLGQINLVLAALVGLDCLLVRSRRRGVLTGVAAGIKLTPAIFIGYHLLRRDWRAAGRSVVAGGLTVLAGGVAAPRASWRFWTRLWFDPGHVGGVAYVDNQSLFGVLVRVFRSEHPPQFWVLVVDDAVLALGGLATRRQLHAGQPLAAVTSVGFTGLLVSPISWSHHWVWLVPAVLILWQRRHLLGCAVLVAVGYLAPQWFVPAGGRHELHQSWWQQVCCASFALAGALFLVLMCRPLPRSDDEDVQRARAVHSLDPVELDVTGGAGA